MKIIEIQFTEKFGGSWSAIEAPGVEPTYPGPKGRQFAVDYATNRFGGAAGEVHVYDQAGAEIVQKIPVDKLDFYRR